MNCNKIRSVVLQLSNTYVSLCHNENLYFILNFTFFFFLTNSSIQKTSVVVSLSLLLSLLLYFFFHQIGKGHLGCTAAIITGNSANENQCLFQNVKETCEETYRPKPVFGVCEQLQLQRILQKAADDLREDAFTFE